MNDSTVVFATKQDLPFLSENANLTVDLPDRKLKYNGMLLAKVNEEPIGLLILEYLWSHIPFIEQIWIQNDFRKKGIGKSLVN